MEGPSKVTLIYFIGGCTHAEISALRFLARQDNSKFIVKHLLNTSVLLRGKNILSCELHARLQNITFMVTVIIYSIFTLS